MNTETSIVCKLGGYSDSHPEILSSYPSIEIAPEKTKELILKCLPIGSQVGDFVVDKYDKHNLLSYVFKIEEEEFRDDLLSYSILLDKKLNMEIYKRVLKNLFETLEKNRLLSEIVIKTYQKSIFEGINKEIDIEIEHVIINFSEYFKKVKAELIKPKPKVKGSFF